MHSRSCELSGMTATVSCRSSAYLAKNLVISLDPAALESKQARRGGFCGTMGDDRQQELSIVDQDHIFPKIIQIATDPATCLSLTLSPHAHAVSFSFELAKEFSIASEEREIVSFLLLQHLCYILVFLQSIRKIICDIFRVCR